MDNKMASDRSYSGSSSSSSGSSSKSSDVDEDSMEPVRVLGTTLELPQELCENYSLFKEFFSMKTWESLDDKHKEHLKKFLPKFKNNQEEETEKTIKMLFNYEPFHFTNPLNDFYSNLKQGNYRPDIAKMRKFLTKARSKQQRHKVKSYYAKLLPEVLISRERLLAAAKSAPPGPVPSIPCLPPKPSSKNNFKPVYLRAKQRYFEELAAIRSEVGGVETEDENYPEGPPEHSNKRRRQAGPTENSNIWGTLSISDQPQPTSVQCLKNVLAAHRLRRQYRENHPELNTANITLEDIKQRVAIVNGAKKLMFGGQKLASPASKLKRGPKKDPNKRKLSDGKVIKKVKEETDNVENRPLLPNIKIKCEKEESDSESSSFVDPVASPKQSKQSLDSVEIKQELVDSKYTDVSDSGYDPTLEIKQELPDVIPLSFNSKMPVHQPVPIKLEDLDGIDMMDLPIEIADDSGEVIQVDTTMDCADEHSIEVDESLTETTHANFLSLVRALFPARDAHRASKQQLHARCAAVLKSPIAPLNTWYNQSDDWCADLDSALDFLSGERGTHPEDFVPYLQYMPETQVGSEEPVKIYQWIGAGRDCDTILGRLCERWMRASSPQLPSKEPPPPKYPTTWTVRPPSAEDIYLFRAQERRRYTTAAKPFAYVQHGYRAVVGPCARCWAPCGGTGTALLAAERPRHATFASLVRDALARLPNGDGTRHDVFTLIKMSQYIAPCSEQALLNAVTTVLEKFSTAKRDRFVKYDQKTAIWTYLHRNKTEEDWLNKTASGRSRAVKAAPASCAPPAAPSTPPSPSPAPPTKPTAPAMKEPQHTPPHMMDLDVSTVEEVIEASDSDVDVDDSSLPTSAPQLSSAQLLMQATQTQVKQPTPPKTKKQTPTLKRSYTLKNNTQAKQAKAALMTQSVKQANLLAQSVKQASLAAQNKVLVQAVKNAAPKHTVVVPAPKTTVTQAKTTLAVKQMTGSKTAIKVHVKQPVSSAKPLQSPKQPPASPKQLPQSPKHSPQSPMQPPQSPMQPPQSPKPLAPSPKPLQPVKQPAPSPKPVLPVSTVVKTVICQPAPSPVLTQTTISKSLPSIIATPHKSPLIKQRPLLKSDTNIVAVSKVSPGVISQLPTMTTVIQPIASTSILQAQAHIKVAAQGTRSLLIRPPAIQTTVTAVSTPAAQTAAGRRGVVRVLSPAHMPSGKSLISPRALLQDGPPAKKRAIGNTISASAVPQLQSMATGTSVVNSVPAAVTSAVQTRTVQLAGGRTVQLANQTVHLPSGQSVQLSSGHTLQLSSLHLPHSVRLPSGQTVQLATPQAIQALKASQAKNPHPRAQSTPIKTAQQIQVPISTVQLSGQTVQIGGQTVQLTGHTVKLPSGQSVQVASQNIIPSSVQLPSGHTVQLPSGQTVQLAAGNVQTVQIAGSNMQLAGQSVQLQTTGQNVQLGTQTVQLASGQNIQLPQTVQIGGQTVQIASGQSVQLPSGQTIQLPSGQTVQLPSGQTLQLPSGQTLQLPSGQTVQLPGGQAVQLPGGQTVQLPSGQTVQLSSGQTLQLASGQTVQLANQTAKSMTQIVRNQTQGDKMATTQPIKLLTNAQGQMVSLEGLSGSGRAIVSGIRPRPSVRVLPPAARLARPLLLTSAKPLHNIILQQSDGTVRVPSSAGVNTSQTIVISSIASPTVTTPTTAAPVLKLQQVNTIQQVKLAQGIKLQQPGATPGVATSSGVRSVLMDGQQLKLVGGRHVLARILRPAHPPNQ